MTSTALFQHLLPFAVGRYLCDKTRHFLPFAL